MAARPECANGARRRSVRHAARAHAQRLIKLENNRERPASRKQDEFVSRSSILNQRLAWISLALLIYSAQLLMGSNQHRLQIAIPSSVARERHRAHSNELSAGRHQHRSTHGQLHSNQTGTRHAPAGVWRRASEYLSETPATGQWPASARPHASQRAHGLARDHISGQTKQLDLKPAGCNEQGFRLAGKLPVGEQDGDDDDDYQDSWRTLEPVSAHNGGRGRSRARQRLAPSRGDTGNLYVSHGEHYAIITAPRSRRLRASEGPQSKVEPASISGDGFMSRQSDFQETVLAGSATGGDANATSDESDENDEPTDEKDDNWTESGSPVSSGSATQSSSPASSDTGESCDSIEGILATRPSRTTGWVFGFNYSIIFVFGLLGNVITLYVLICKGKKCSAQDILIANLACSDIMLCVFSVPITPKYLILDGHWTLGPALCKVVSFAQSTSVYMSTYSLICIGYIRYRLIVHPLEESMSKRTALLSCLGTWGVSLLITLPYTLQVRLSPENCDIKFCDEAWEKPYLRFVFSLFTTFFQFIIPLGSVGFFNKKIYSRLDGRRLGAGHQADHKSVPATNAGSNSHPSGARPGHKLAAAGEHGVGTFAQRASNAHALAGTRDVLAIKEQRQRDKERRMRKANNRLIFVVVIFAHSWLPLNLFNLAQDYFDAMSNWPYLTFTFLIVHQVACSSVCWNPILYAWMSETYRQDLRIALPKFIASRLVSYLAEPPSVHSTGVAHSHHAANTTATHIAHSQHSLVQVHHSVTTSGFGFLAAKHSANSSLGPASLPPVSIAQQTSGAASCDELCELTSGTAPSSSCGPCALELNARRALGEGQDFALDVRSDTTFDDDQELCCCRHLAKGAHAHEDERSQSSSGPCQPLTNGTGRAYAEPAGGSKLAAIRSLSGEQSGSSLASAVCASGATSDAKSAQIVI